MLDTDDIKLVLRISHDKLDDEIDSTLSEARAELIRSGVDSDAVEEEGPLVQRAIKTYCLAQLSGDKDLAEGYQRSFEVMEDTLRKSTLSEE